MGEVALVVDTDSKPLVLAKHTKTFSTEIGFAGLCEAFNKDDRHQDDEEEWGGIQ